MSTQILLSRPDEIWQKQQKAEVTSIIQLVTEVNQGGYKNKMIQHAKK